MSIYNFKLPLLCLFLCCYQYSLAADDVFVDKAPMLGRSMSIIAVQEVDFVVGLPLTTNINALLEKEAECYNFQLRQLPSR